MSNKFINAIIGLVIVAILIGALAPTAISQITGATTTGWDLATQNVWLVIPILVIVGFFLLIVRMALSTGKGRDN